MKKVLFSLLLLCHAISAVENGKGDRSSSETQKHSNGASDIQKHSDGTPAIQRSNGTSAVQKRPNPTSDLQKHSNHTSEPHSSQTPRPQTHSSQTPRPQTHSSQAPDLQTNSNRTSVPQKNSTFRKPKDYDQVKNVLNALRDKAAKSNPTKPHTQPGNTPMVDNAEEQDETEVSKNAKIRADVFEGDIVLTLKQAKSLLEDADTNLEPQGASAKTKRKVARDADQRWPGNVVYYTYQIGLDSYKISAIEAAIGIWQENTCVRFQPGTGSGDFITFVAGSGCYSSIGKTGGQQEVSIGDGCETSGTASHEIGHTLGFWHEQSRFDRNDYVKLERENIYEQEYWNFMRASRRIMDDFGVPYDLGSVMHYGPKAFSINNGITIRTLDKNYQRTIGQREKLTFADIKQVNMAYCSRVCGSNSVSCQHGGYPDPSGGGARCRFCRCPTGFSGTYCETVEPSFTANCGGVLNATTSWQTLSTPDARPNRHCNWLIKAPGNAKITLEVLNVDTRCRLTCTSYLEVKPGPNFVSTGSRFCCQNSWQNPIISDHSEMILIYHTDSFRRNSGYGAEVRYRSEVSESGVIGTGTEKSNLIGSGAVGQGPWRDWSVWSQCTQPCGGCGLKFRTRTCNGHGCSGDPSERVSCGEALCASAAVDDSIGSMCRFRTRVPCSYFFRSPSGNQAGDSKPQFDTPKNFDGKLHEVQLRPERYYSHRRHHYHDGGRRKRDSGSLRNVEALIRETRDATDNYCNAYGYYPCSQRSPYFYRTMDSDEEGQRRRSASNDVRQCCRGFEPKGTACVQRRMRN